jgi:hypothetical protein
LGGYDLALTMVALLQDKIRPHIVLDELEVYSSEALSFHLHFVQRAGTSTWRGKQPLAFSTFLSHVIRKYEFPLPPLKDANVRLSPAA